MNSIKDQSLMIKKILKTKSVLDEGRKGNSFLLIRIHDSGVCVGSGGGGGMPVTTSTAERQ